MGRLLTRVREAEEKLAAVGKALQSAYEEELADAVAARDAARASLSRARAMEQAARAMGRDELVQRVRDVLSQLESSAGEAEQRLLTLDHVEEELRARLDGRVPVALPAPVKVEPKPPEPAPEVVIPVTASPVVPEVREVTPPVPKPAPVTTPFEEPPSAAEEILQAAVEAAENPELVPKPEHPEPEVPPVAAAPEPAVPPSAPETSGPTVLRLDPEAIDVDEEVIEVEHAEVVDPGHGELEADEDGPKTRPIAISRPPVPEEDDDSADDLAPAPKPVSPKLAELHTRLAQLQGRVDEIAKGAVKWARPVTRLAVQEHVALSRLLAQRFDGQGEDGRALVAGCLGQLAEVARTFSLEDVVGLSPADTSDWNKLATEARLKRVALVEARKAARQKDS